MADIDLSTSGDSALPQRFPKRDLTGQRFGRLVVTGFAEYRKEKAYWQCLCDCTNLLIASANNLLTSNTTSCGCYCIEMRTRHGQSKTSLCKRWTAMLQRCENPNANAYERYGGRGITVCYQWHIFENFVSDMGNPPKGMTIERRDNNGNYSKENCYWGTKEEQANNTRRNVFLTLHGETKTMALWCRENGLHQSTVQARLTFREWNIEDALTKPSRQHKDMLVSLAKENGIPIATVRRRIRQGWSQERALTTPVRRCHRQRDIKDNA